MPTKLRDLLNAVQLFYILFWTTSCHSPGAHAVSMRPTTNTEVSPLDRLTANYLLMAQVHPAKRRQALTKYKNGLRKLCNSQTGLWFHNPCPPVFQLVRLGRVPAAIAYLNAYNRQPKAFRDREDIRLPVVCPVHGDTLVTLALKTLEGRLYDKMIDKLIRDNLVYNADIFAPMDCGIGMAICETILSMGLLRSTESIYEKSEADLEVPDAEEEKQISLINKELEGIYRGTALYKMQLMEPLTCPLDALCFESGILQPRVLSWQHSTPRLRERRMTDLIVASSAGHNANTPVIPDPKIKRGRNSPAKLSEVVTKTEKEQATLTRCSSKERERSLEPDRKKEKIAFYKDLALYSVMVTRDYRDIASFMPGLSFLTALRRCGVPKGIETRDVYWLPPSLFSRIENMKYNQALWNEAFVWLCGTIVNWNRKYLGGGLLVRSQTACVKHVASLRDSLRYNLLHDGFGSKNESLEKLYAVLRTCCFNCKKGLSGQGLCQCCSQFWCGEPWCQRCHERYARRVQKKPMHVCSFCEQPRARLRCTGCNIKTWYCNRLCQKQHWKTHELVCAKAREISEKSLACSWQNCPSNELDPWPVSEANFVRCHYEKCRRKHIAVWCKRGKCREYGLWLVRKHGVKCHKGLDSNSAVVQGLLRFMLSFNVHCTIAASSPGKYLEPSGEELLAAFDRLMDKLHPFPFTPEAFVEGLRMTYQQRQEALSKLARTIVLPPCDASDK